MTKKLVLPKQIIKRNGMYVEFDPNRIHRAVSKCYASFEDDDNKPAASVEDVVAAVTNYVAHKFKDAIPTVEDVQDIVEISLISSGEFEAARRYILYREEHAKQRVV